MFSDGEVKECISDDDTAGLTVHSTFYMREPLISSHSSIRVSKKRVLFIFTPMEKYKTVCVYCGSSIGIDPVFRESAIALAEYLVAERYRLVNGGGNIGLMGVMANRILELGGEAIGVIPQGLKDREVAHLGMTELIVVPDMHSRKLAMVNLSDAFIALPGGFGTLDELFETLTWSQLHLHKKPIGILNTGGYFDPLLQMVDKMVRADFLSSDARTLLHSDDDIASLFTKLYGPHLYSHAKWDRPER